MWQFTSCNLQLNRVASLPCSLDSNLFFKNQINRSSGQTRTVSWLIAEWRVGFNFKNHLKAAVFADFHCSIVLNRSLAMLASNVEEFLLSNLSSNLYSNLFSKWRKMKNRTRSWNFATLVFWKVWSLNFRHAPHVVWHISLRERRSRYWSLQTPNRQSSSSWTRPPSVTVP